MNQPEVTKRGGFDMQVCVHKNWTDEQIFDFVNQQNPCGTKAGWQIRKEGHWLLNGEPERRQCLEPCRKDYVHVMLDS